MRVVLWGLLLLLGAAPALSAQPGDQSDAVEWLKKIARAARDLNYTGTFVYQYGGQSETSRIVHRVDRKGEHEKLERLDGPPREIIRSNDEVLCFLPNTKTVKVEKRITRKSFPALLSEQFDNITDNYTVRKGEQERIAGLDAQRLILDPRDALRYGRQLWADVSSGLLLKAITVNEHNQPVEQFAFTQVTIGGKIDKDLLKPTYSAKDPGWRSEAAVPAPDGESGDPGWIIGNQPQGFRKIMELKRTWGANNTPVIHIVLSDGIAAVSVFIEQLSPDEKKAPTAGLSNQGAINVYRKITSGHWVTVLGEAPPATVIQIGNSLIPKGERSPQ